MLKEINKKHPGSLEDLELVHFAEFIPKWGDLPFITLHTTDGGWSPLAGTYEKRMWKAPACNLKLGNHIRYDKHARLISVNGFAKPVFSLSGQFFKDKSPFHFRSDKYFWQIEKQYSGILKLADKCKNQCVEMKLYDNRRTAPDDLLLHWKNGNIVYQNHYLPFATIQPLISTGVLQFINKHLQVA